MYKLLKKLEELNINYYITIEDKIIPVKNNIDELLDNSIIGKQQKTYKNINEKETTNYSVIEIKLEKITSILVDGKDELFKSVLWQKFETFDGEIKELNISKEIEKVSSYKQLLLFLIENIVQQFKKYIELEVYSQNISSKPEYFKKEGFSLLFPKKSNHIDFFNDNCLFLNYNFKNKNEDIYLEKICFNLISVNQIRFSGNQTIFDNPLFSKENGKQIFRIIE